MNPLKLTAGDLADIRRMVPTCGYAYVARWIGCSNRTVRHHARKMGVEPNQTAPMVMPATLVCPIKE